AGALAFGPAEQTADPGVEVDLGNFAIELVLAARDLDAAAERREAALRVVDSLLAARDFRLVDDGDVAVCLDLLQLALAVGAGDEVAGHQVGAHLPAGLGHDDIAASHHDLALGPVFEAVLRGDRLGRRRRLEVLAGDHHDALVHVVVGFVAIDGLGRRGDLDGAFSHHPRDLAAAAAIGIVG